MSNYLKDLLAGKSDDEQEPLLRKSLDNLIPSEMDDINKAFKQMYENMISVIWTPGEVKLIDDQIHMKNRLTGAEIKAIRFVLSFFANSDTIVADNIKFNLGAEVQPFYCKVGYNFIVAMEDIHAITYDRIMLALFPDEYIRIKKEIIHIPEIKNKINFMAKWMADNCTFNERVIAFLCVEAIMFSSSFAIIFWFKTRGLLPGTIQANELIATDEGMHQDFGVLIHKFTKNKTPAGRIHEIIKEAVSAEILFISAAVPESIKDLSKERLVIYVQYIADRLAVQLGTDKIYNVANSCEYMVNLGIESKTNLFEKTGTTYLTPSADTSLKFVDF